MKLTKRVEVGRHFYHNRFPNVLRYLFPRFLNKVTYQYAKGCKIYKFLYWYISVSDKLSGGAG